MIRNSKRNIVFTLVVLISSVGVLETANAQSTSYKLGYTWASETNPDTLIGYLIKNNFDLNGNPVKSKIKSWCGDMFGRENWNRVNIQGKPSAKRADWVNGCTAKVMTYRFKRR
jgi:hypothetical protein